MDILLVEDSDIAVRVISHNLRSLGCAVTVAKTGLEAITMFHHNYDAILLDVGLPELSGYEVAKIIRANETKRNIILGISSLGSQIRDECLRCGFNEVYKKPIDIIDLLEIINRIKNDERETNITRSCQILRNLYAAGYYQTKRRPLP